MPFADETFCQSSAKNTGMEGCPLVIKSIKQAIWAPLDTAWDAAARATPTTTLKALLLADNPNARGALMPKMIAEVVDSSTDALKVQWANGSEKTTKASQPKYTFIMDTLDLRALEAVQQYNDSENEYGLFLVDEQDKILGTKYIDDSGEEFIRPFNYVETFADTVRFYNGEAQKIGVMVSFSKPEQFNNGNMLVWDTGIDVDALPRMNSLVLSQKTAADASRVVDVKVMVGKTNFATTRNADKLAVTGAWKGTTATGAALTVSSVSKVLVGGEYVYRVTFSATGYPSSAGVFYVNLVAPSALDALTLPLEGYESAGYLSQTAV